MRCSFFILAALVVGALSARAQVSVNLNALDQLERTPAARPVPGPTRPVQPTAGPLPLPPTPMLPSAPAAPGAPAALGAPAAPTMAGTSIGPLPAPPPARPPATPVLAPVVVVGPPHPEPVPAPPSVVDGAQGAAISIPGGIRVTFGAAAAALNPVTLAALREEAAAVVRAKAPAVAVDAYAALDPSDPSTARRLSLSRALAARAVLREAGIPSERIYVRALLALPAKSEPANRVDVTLVTPPKGSP